MTKIIPKDAIALAQEVAAGKITALALVEQAIARAEQVNPSINAIIQPLYERATQEAQTIHSSTPLAGVPFVVKDLHTPSKGDPQHEGSAVLKAMDYRATHDCFLVETCRQAGLLTIGRTNVPELASGPDCEPYAYGPTKNPWNLAYSSLGSSGGSAATVAAGIVPIAHGTDGGGSVRIPASACGIVGLKPSRGRISNGPDKGENWGGFGTNGIHSRTIRDAAAVLDIMATPMPGDPYRIERPPVSFLKQLEASIARLKIGVVSQLENPEIHQDCLVATEKTAKLLKDLGHQVEVAQPSALKEEEFNKHFFRIVSCHVTQGIEAWGKRIGRQFGEKDVEPVTWFWMKYARSVSTTGYLDSLHWLHRFSRRMARWWEAGFDLLLTPTLACPPPKLGFANNPKHAAKVNLKIVRFMTPFNVTGQPAVTLPLHWNEEGLPIGIQLVAAYGREDLLLRLASQIEQAQSWHSQLPPIFADH